MNADTHGRRFKGTGDRLRSPARIGLLEVERVVALCSEGLTIKTVLDIGTGTGLFAEAFCKLGLTVAGIDSNAELLTAASNHVPQAAMMQALAESLPFADRSFDLAFLGHVLHEADAPSKALGEARRVARMRVAVLEWPYCDEERGPPLEHRLSPAAIEGFARNCAFETVERVKLQHMDLYRLAPRIL